MTGSATPLWGLVLDIARRCLEPGATARSIAAWLGATAEPVGESRHLLIEAPRHPSLLNVSVVTESADVRPDHVTLRFPMPTAPHLSELGPAERWKPGARMSWQLPFHWQPGPSGSYGAVMLFAHSVTDDAAAADPRIGELVIRIDRP